MRIVLACTCAPFEGEKDFIQRAAVFSWEKVGFSSIVFIGDEPSDQMMDWFGDHCLRVSIPETATSLGFTGCKGVPLMDAALEWLRTHARPDILVWVNSDIIIRDPEWTKGLLLKVAELTHKDFIILARRRNLYDWVKYIDSEDVGNTAVGPFLHNVRVTREEVLQETAGIDFYAWGSVTLEKNGMPAFIANAWRVDTWMEENASRISPNVFDLTKELNLLHCMHSTQIQNDPEWKRCCEYNRQLREKSSTHTPLKLTELTL